MSGPCAKAVVVCEIISEDGSRVFTGRNDCQNPQPVCPRLAAGETGRGQYRLCREVCRQPHHAEIAALQAAGPWAVGASVYVRHHRCCPDCRAALTAAGVADIVLLPPA